MKISDTRAAASQSAHSIDTAASRLAALEHLIAYARDEAEKLKVDLLVFCLDASLSVARGEARIRKVDPRSRARAQASGRRKACH